MVISSLVVETTPGKVHTVAEELAKIPGVEVHNDSGYKIVVTLETETTRQSHDIAAGFISISGVSNVNLICSFEDPELQAGELSAEATNSRTGARRRRVRCAAARPGQTLESACAQRPPGRRNPPAQGRSRRKRGGEAMAERTEGASVCPPCCIPVLALFCIPPLAGGRALGAASGAEELSAPREPALLRLAFVVDDRGSGP